MAANSVQTKMTDASLAQKGEVQDSGQVSQAPDHRTPSLNCCNLSNIGLFIFSLK